MWWSQFFNMSIFLLLIYLSYDWNLSYLYSLSNYVITKTKRFATKIWNGDSVKELTDEEKKKIDKEDQENVGITALFDKDSEYKLAKNVPDRLSDVKGIDEVKEEIEEIVQMLKEPQKYEEAGAKLIRGVLLVGQPGTGKTLLARALAGESGINFIYLSASEFEQSIVGMGTVKLKKLFKYARKNQPCIIFIDEIDSLLHKGKRSG